MGSDMHSTRWQALGAGLLIGGPAMLVALPARAAELPVPCIAGSCGNVSSFVTSGAASAAVSGSLMTVTQTTDTAILNWQSFNISSDGQVQFIQPDSSSLALNRIYQNSPAQIFGALNANGRVYLLNQNGIVFGAGATINVAGLVASSLDITPSALDEGLLAAATHGEAAFTQYRDANGAALASGAVRVSPGATIATADGGSVLMFAPEISNQGSIHTPGGQTLLAAGSPVYLTASSDPNLRGLLVEVGTGGTVTNGDASNAALIDPAQMVGQIVAERGNITLAGLAVNQLGRVTATTSISQNGSVYLLARDGGSVQGGSVPQLSAGNGGELTLGVNSQISISLDQSSDTTVDATAQPQSTVRLDGRHIKIESGASIVAPHGVVTAIARGNSGLQPEGFKAGAVSDAYLDVAAGALIDVSGASIEKSMESNVLEVELRGTELADSPLQRDGELRGSTVSIDTRLYGTRADGSSWAGSPIGDLSGWINAVKRDVSERSLTGGTISLYSEGSVNLAAGSVLDVSGGSIHYASGYINTTQLLGANGRLYDIGAADRDVVYAGIVNSGAIAVEHPRWSVTETFQGYNTQGRYEAAYVEGKDAGTLNISGQSVAMQGTIRAATEAGIHQRKLPATVSATALYRPYDQLPLSGALVLGNAVTTAQTKDYQLGDVAFVTETASDADPSLTQLRIGLLTDSGIGRLTVRANGEVTIPDEVSLSMPAGGSVDIRSASIDVAGSIVAPSGSISLAAAQTVRGDDYSDGLTIRSGALLDVAGRWVNDLAVVNGGTAGHAPLAIRGGSITLIGETRDLLIDAGAVLDASGGAQLSASNRLTSGNGGSISIISTVPRSGVAPRLVIDGTLRAAAMTHGGTLNISGSAFCIGAAGSVCVDTTDGLLRLAPTFFDSGGFSAYSLSSTQGGIELVAGTALNLQATNLIADNALYGMSSGARLADLLSLGRLDDVERKPVNLSLSVAPSLPEGADYGATTFAVAPDLVIGTGAAINADIGAAISLRSTSRLLVDGTISAAAGSIDLLLDSTMPISSGDPNGYFSSQGIWLGDQAQLLARGASRLITDDQGRISGEVLEGGTVTINAQRGHVLTSRGSLIDVSGTSADLDIRSNSLGSYRRTSIGSAAGTIDISASEAIVVGGQLVGMSGDPGVVAGGTLKLTLNPLLRSDSAQFTEMPYERFPSMNRVIELSATGGGQVFGNSVLPSHLQGRALLGVDQVTDGGFDALSLTARSFETTGSSGINAHPGSVLLSGDLDLSLARSLVIDSAIIASDGGLATLRAPLLTIGHSDPRRQSSQALTTGNGRLHLQAGLLDVVGISVLQNFDDVLLQSDGDLRLRGVVPLEGTTVDGALATAGSLTLSAAQVYPTTLTQFTVSAGSGNDGTLTVSRPSGATAADALSAAAQLTLRAPHVVQAGTLRAPFGSLIIDSPDIALTAGSVTSTSGAGLNVLFGSTQGGFDWVYSVGSDRTVVFDENNPLPAQQIQLRGENVAILDGATIDVRGGGSLLASEFVPGTTGTVDVLGADSDGAFAILPATSLAAMPADVQIAANTAVDGSRSVYLEGGAGFDSGTYIILPAQYAALPGAYLVKQSGSYTDIAPGENYRLADGSAVVRGYYTATGTTLRDSRSSGFIVQSADMVQDRAHYTVTSADDFYTARAADAGVSPTRLPRDAGTLAILASGSLQLDGDLLGSSDNGRGAALDIASARITIVDETSPPSGDGGLLLQAAALNAFGAESILIGGTRREVADGTVIATQADSVVVAGGAQLTASELMLVASNSVEVQTGASLSGVATTQDIDRDVQLSGDGAFLRVAGGDVVDVARSGSAGAVGSLVIADGARLNAAGGAINLESTRAARLDGIIAATRGSLSITGNQISLGNVPQGLVGFALSADRLQGLDLSSIVLHSRSSIDLYGDTSSMLTALSGDNVVLEAQALRGMGGSVRIAASDTLRLAGVEDGTGTVTGGGSGSLLLLEAGEIQLAGGGLSLLGFEQNELQASREIRAVQDTRLDAQGDLTFRSPRLTTTSGRSLSAVATGTLAVRAASTTLAAAESELGGVVDLTGARVAISGTIALPSGRVSLTSTSTTVGGISLEDGALIDLAGIASTFDGEQVYSRGGQLIARAQSGDLQVAAGARIDVSADGGADAGRVQFDAPAGTLRIDGVLDGSAAEGGLAGSFSADAQQLPELNTMQALLVAGGFGGDLALRQRGAGSLSLAADRTLQARSIALTADSGSIEVAGTLRASAADGGRIQLIARDGIAVDGQLDARAADASQRNGRIDLQASEGGIRIGSGARVATLATEAASGSAADGQINLRVRREALATVLDADAGNDTVALQGDWSAAGPVIVEGYAAYVDADGSISGTDVLADVSNPYYAEASSFAGQADALVAALGQGRIAGLQVRPGIEIRTAEGQDLSLDTDWNLSTWRFNAQPGVLSLRAGGNLLFNASLSDGFSGTTGANAFLVRSVAESWSYRLSAGADLNSADVLAVQSQPEVGSLRIAAGDPESTSGYRMIRTGTGSIDINVAGDVELGNAASMIYTAGIFQRGVSFPGDGELGTSRYVMNGGDISISAGRDIIGADSGQLVTDWLWRVGNTDSGSADQTRATAWTVAFGSFRQNIGALGGGDVRVSAGRNVDTLSVSSAAVGVQTGGTASEQNSVTVTGGGQVQVVAGNDILGGSYYAGRGAVRLDAGGDIGRSTRTGLGAVIALGDASAALTARNNLVLQAVVNPTLLPQSSTQGATDSGLSVFNSYGDDSRVSATAMAGDLEFDNSYELPSTLPNMNFSSSVGSDTGLQLYPGTLDALSLRGSVEVNGSITLAPVDDGMLSLRAYDDVKIANGAQLIVSDVDPALLPTIARPTGAWDEDIAAVLKSAATGSRNFHAATPVRLEAAQQGRLQRSRIVAQHGDIDQTDAAGSQSIVYSGAPVRLYAGRDVVNLNLVAQNLLPGDVTSVVAGRDIRYSIARTPIGSIAQNSGQITVDGPGQVLLQAGRDINLQNSAGITTRGALANPALDAEGASISMLAGLNGNAPDYAGFERRYLQESTTYDAALSAFLTRVTGATPSDREAALATFDQLMPELRTVFLQQVLLAELRASGRAAASADARLHGDYSAGFRALETMFPGSNPDLDDGETNRYGGDIALYFSRVYTLAGGDITMLAPGGGVNAGLATPPSSFGVNKAPSELGIVAQSVGNIGVLTYDDLQVNESRVFAADGGDILVWATRGDIDAGRGAKTAVSAPPPTITIDTNGQLIVSFPAALTGSGIQTLATSEGTEPGDVDLFAPRGVVNAGDAGIVAGNLTIGATAVLGADNIKVSGVAVGVPVDAGGLGASLSGVSSQASSASSAVGGSLDDTAGQQSQAPLAQAALSWLEVFVLGLGEENCKPDDVECLKRQQ